MNTIGFVGGGRVVRILLNSFARSGIQFQKVIVTDPNQDVLDKLQQEFTYVSTAFSIDQVAQCDLLVLAVHPPVMLEVLASIKGNIRRNSVILSLAPKITISKMNEMLGGHANIARMNPSASSVVNRGVNPITFSENFDQESKSELLRLFEVTGQVPVVDESKIEAYAMISAMGHTYFFFQLQKLKELAIEFGMDEVEAEKTITNMLWGTTETLFNSGLKYHEVTDLIPVKPLGEVEKNIADYYDQYLVPLFNKIKP
jgi:pyrroline-5-carboxylate reductase